ncbi:TLDc domain-containing protein [Entamoeba marina]
MENTPSKQENSKITKQFEKEKENMKKYAKDFAKFFDIKKTKPTFNIIYTSTLDGFSKDKLNKVLPGLSNIMFIFETVHGDVFGCYNNETIPDSLDYGSVSISNDKHFILFSLVNRTAYGSFSLTVKNLVSAKQQESQFNPLGVIQPSLNPVSAVTSMSSAVLDSTSKIVGATQNVVGIQSNEKKKDQKLRSLFISSGINDHWTLETYCGFILTGNEVMFNKQLGNYYNIQSPPIGVDLDKEEDVVKFMVQAKDVFVGGTQPKAVEIKKLVALQWSFDKKKE